MFPRDTLATGVDDIQIDMANAGFTVVNEPVVYDKGQRLITSPNPKTLKQFCEELGARMREVSPVRSW
jgi:putative intracellular protease/amidase